MDNDDHIGPFNVGNPGGLLALGMAGKAAQPRQRRGWCGPPAVELGAFSRRHAVPLAPPPAFPDLHRWLLLPLEPSSP